jgi:iron complex outermembrane receptor protein
VKRSGGEDVDFSGNALTGTSPHISVTSLDLQIKRGFYSNFTFNFTDRIPLNDANTVYADRYHLITWKIGYHRNLNRIVGVDFFVGVDNLLNEKYSLGNDLNAFGNRYYNPSAERNYFAGLKVVLNKDPF